jgi:nucleotide-binding universal stress UspA family protein
VQIAARAGSSVLVARENLPAPGPVLVGVDGSASSYAAVGFAFDAAARRVREVVVVRVWDPVEAPDGVEAEIVEEVEVALAPWRERFPSVRVDQRVRAGDPKTVLVEESRVVELAVVSARGEQPWRGMLGAVSQALLYHSPTPVVVVRTAHELYVQE